MGRPLGFKTLITPSKEKVVLHQRRLAEIIRRHRAAPQEALIAHLNPIIRGWCNYYRTSGEFGYLQQDGITDCSKAS